MEKLTKHSLRAEARRILAGLLGEERAAGSAEICRRIEALPEWKAAGTVALYVAQSSEPVLAPLFGAFGKRVCLPRVAGDTLEFHRCSSEELLRPGPWNLLEPHPEDCPVIPPGEIDLLCIPGLAFTRGGGRLGRGGGFYDRFLKRTHPRVVKLGICFHAQMVEALPLELHDHEVDQVVTEVAVYGRGA